MKKAFVLMETFAVAAVVLLSVMFLTELLVSSCKVVHRAKESYTMQKMKSETINALQSGAEITLPADYKISKSEQTNTTKIEITKQNSVTGKEGKGYVVWKK